MAAHYLQQGGNNVMELELSLMDIDKPDMPLEDQIMAAGNDIKSDLNTHNTTIGQDPLAIKNDPQTLLQAQASNKWSNWEKVIEVKLNSLKDAGTWAITDLPEGRKAITAKWVFKAKHNANGNVAKYKARLVAWGFTQMHGVDYHDTYSPVHGLHRRSQHTTGPLSGKLATYGPKPLASH
ncbi:hypothetical protein NDA13_000200 [Ustilago tritici]|nr:hypothetical protein NDA13_000200 [Ustilago tritici]